MSDGDPAERSARRRRAVTASLGGAVVLAAILVPPHLGGYKLYLLSLIVIYGLSTVAFNVLIGWSGQIGLAHAGFFGFGAYATSIMHEKGVPWPLALVAAAIAAALAGVIVGFPAAQLRGFFLAIATLAFGELIVRILIEARGLTGGGGGYSVTTFRIAGGDRTLSTYYLALGALVLFSLAVARLMHGRLGRTLIAVNEIEIATGSLAISAARYKLVAFAISAFGASAAGALFAQLLTYLSPDLFRTNLLISMLVMLIVGGIRSIWGSVIGAAFFVAVQEVFQETGEYQRLVFGVALMVMVVVLPGGLASLPSRLRERFRRRYTDTGDVAPAPADHGAMVT